MELTDIEQDLEEKNVVWEVIWWPRDTLEPLWNNRHTHFGNLIMQVDWSTDFT